MKLHSERTLQRNRYAAQGTRARMIAAFCPSDAGFLTDSACGSFARHKLRHPALPPGAVRCIRPGVRMWSAIGPRREFQNKALRFVWWYQMYLSILACALRASLSLGGVRLKCTVGFNPYDSHSPWSRRMPCPAGPHGPGLRRSLNHPADRRVLTHTHGCSHRLPSRSARRNPKAGLPNCQGAPELLRCH